MLLLGPSRVLATGFLTLCLTTFTSGQAPIQSLPIPVLILFVPPISL
jgi:hypothetical protein